MHKLLKEKDTELHKLAAGLLEFETLNVDEVRRVISGEDFKLEV